MTLVDWQIQRECRDSSFTPQWWNLKAWFYKFAPLPKQSMIEPYDPHLINAASYDVRIGDRIKVARYGKAWQEVLLIDDQSESYELIQGEFILAETDCIFHIPRNISAQFALKSSRGREGYEHLSAGFIDPAWHGSKLTMELFNANPNPIPIYKGLKIGQIIFTRCDGHPIKAYDERGRYNGDLRVTESKG